LIVTSPCCDMSSIMTDFVEGEMCLWKSMNDLEPWRDATKKHSLG
jgi:hypothetical protein